MEVFRRARHRLLLLQRRQRLGRHLPQGVADRREAGLSAASPCTCPRPWTTTSPITDNCPGFGSVAKYVATSMREAGIRRGVDGQDVDQGLRARGDGPARRLDHGGRRHGRRRRTRRSRSCCCSPRSPSTRRRSSRRSTPEVKKFGYCCIGVSEGLLNDDGKLMAEAGTRDAFGHAQLGGVGPLIARTGEGRSSATSTTGRWPTTCSARRAISPRRPTSRSRMRWARRRSNWRSRDTTR